MEKLVNELEELTHKLSDCFESGVNVYPSDKKTIEISINNLHWLLERMKK